MSRPRVSVRLRLVLMVGCSFFLFGVLLLIMAFLLVRHARLSQPLVPVGEVLALLDGVPSGDDIQQVVTGIRRDERRDALREAVRQSWLVLLALTIVSMGIAWLASGMLLRPVRTLLSHIRATSETTLGQSVSLGGPEDEFRDLGVAYDAMQERLRVAFESQRRFSAAAAHELRTPLAIIRAEAELLATGPERTAREQAAGASILAVTDRSVRLIEGLLALSRAESDLLARSRLDLADLVGDVAGELVTAADAMRLDFRLALAATPIAGDPVLVRHLVTNLLQNAIRYNDEDGWVEVTVGVSGGAARLVVANTGPVVTASADSLFAPFQRGERQDGAGAGLGLTIVRAVTLAHGGQVVATPRQDGGLDVVVTLPRLPPP